MPCFSTRLKKSPALYYDIKKREIVFYGYGHVDYIYILFFFKQKLTMDIFINKAMHTRNMLICIYCGTSFVIWILLSSASIRVIEALIYITLNWNIKNRVFKMRSLLQTTTLSFHLNHDTRCH